MSYIEREPLIKTLNGLYKHHLTMRNYAADGATFDCISAVIDAPTADVVKVVRCRDCKWWTKQKDSVQGRCGMYGRYPTGAWYCANGERSENGKS